MISTAANSVQRPAKLLRKVERMRVTDVAHIQANLTLQCSIYRNTVQMIFD